MSAIKFEEITVTFQPIKPRSPIIITTDVTQPNNGIITHFMFLKINHSVKIINMKTPAPKTNISFLISLLNNKSFLTGKHNTKFIENNLKNLNVDSHSPSLNHFAKGEDINKDFIKIVHTDKMSLSNRARKTANGEEIKVVYFD